jgi:hypothetical protein
MLRWQTYFRWDALDLLMQGRSVSGLSNPSPLQLDLMLLIESFETMMRSHLSQFLMLTFGAYLIVSSLSNIVALGDYGIVQYAAYRYCSMASAGNIPQVTSFTPQFRGCPISCNSSARLLNTTITQLHENQCTSGLVLEFSSPVAMDGYVLHLTGAERDGGAIGGSVAAAPGQFRLEGSADGGASWTLIGAPVFRQTRRGIRPLPAETAPGNRTDFDHRAPWILAVQCSGIAALGLALAAAGAAAGLRVARPTRGAAAIAALSLAAFQVTQMGGALAAGPARGAFLPATLAALWCGAAAAFARAGRRLPVAGGLLAAANVAVRVVDDCVLFADCENLAADPPYFGVVAALAAAVATLAAERAARRARAAVTVDRTCYDAAWAGVLEREGVAVADAAAAASELAAACDGDGGGSGGPLRQGGAGPASLDRLFAQVRWKIECTGRGEERSRGRVEAGLLAGQARRVTPSWYERAA